MNDPIPIERFGGRRSSDRVSHARLRELTTALQSIREQERAHIARELHDDPGQLLTALRLDLALLLREPGLPAATRHQAQSMDERLLAAITSLRRIATDLRPRALDEAGLYFALQAFRREFSEKTGIRVEMFADEEELTLGDEASTAIYRIVQEGLTNVARHAQASAVTLSLYRLNGSLLITIADNGIGIGEGDLAKPGSLGLLGMRERVWALGGEIAIGREEAGGTRIDITLPMHVP